MESTKSFEARWQRILTCSGAKTDSSLARILEILPQSVTAARKRQQIPSGWIETIAEKFEISADWLLFGRGPMRPNGSPELSAVHNLKPNGSPSACKNPPHAPLLKPQPPLANQEEPCAPHAAPYSFDTPHSPSSPTSPGFSDTPHAPCPSYAPCPRCPNLDARLEEMERERRELTAENRQLWRENAALREENATLRERQYQKAHRSHDETVGNIAG